MCSSQTLTLVVCLSCVPLSLGIVNLRKSFGLGESIKCTVVKPGYTYYKSLSSKLVFDVKVKAKSCMLTYLQYLDFIYDLLVIDSF